MSMLATGTAPKGQDRPDHLLRLWILRILVDLQGDHSFVRDGGFRSDKLATFLGLGKWHDCSSEDFDQRLIKRELASMLANFNTDEVDRTESPLEVNLSRLSSQFALNETDIQILRFAILLPTEKLLNSAADCLGSLPTAQLPQVLSTVLDIDIVSVKHALYETGKLQQCGLLTIDKETYSLENKFDFISTDFTDDMTSGVRDPMYFLRASIRRSAASETSLGDYAHVSQQLDVITSYMSTALEQYKQGVNLLIYGPPGSGKTELAKALGEAMQATVFEVAECDTHGQPMSSTHRLKAFKSVQPLIRDKRSLLLFDEVGDVLGTASDSSKNNQLSKAWINKMLEGNSTPAIWIMNCIWGLDPAYARRFDMVLELDVAPKSLRHKMVNEHFGDNLSAGQIDALANSNKITAGVLSKTANVFNSVTTSIADKDKGQAVEYLVNSTLALQGHDEISMTHTSALPAYYSTEYIETDLDLQVLKQGVQRHGSARICLYGPPGTGKTAFGRYLAGELDKPLLVKKASDLISMWVGATEQNMRDAFKEAEQDKAVLLIDEVDSFLQDRRGAKNSWEVTAVNEMLTQMESYHGVFIATTNLVDSMDQAALRRFDLKAKLDFLSPVKAKHLFMEFAKQLGIAVGTDDLPELVNMTPGDIAAVERRHRFYPFSNCDELLQALQEEVDLKQGARHPIGFY